MTLPDAPPPIPIAFDPPRFTSARGLTDKTVLVALPAAFMKGIPDNAMVEFWETRGDKGLFELRFVRPGTPERTKRYRIASSSKGQQVSVPRRYLQDRSVKDEDRLELLWCPEMTDRLWVAIRRQV